MARPNETGRPRSEILDLLADRDFARVWGAGALLGIVRWLEALAVGIFVIDLTGSASAVAFVGFMRMLPMVLFGAVAGTLGARFNRRRLLTVGSVIGGACAVLLGVLAWTGTIAVWQIAAGSFLTGILWTADFPIRRTLLADIAGPSRIGAAMSADSFNNHGTRLFGAAAGGLLIGSLGLVGAYLICAVLYVAVVFLLLRVRHADAPAPPPTTNLLRETVDGFRVIVAERFLVALLAVTIIFNFFGFAYTAMVPVIGRAVLQADAFAIGLLSSTEAAASLLATLVFAVLAPRRGLGATYALGVLVFMIGVLVFALSSNYWLCLAVMIVTGCAWGAFSVTQSTLMLLAAPAAHRARAMGALVICVGLAPLGMLHLGWMADWLSASTAVWISAGEGIVAVCAVIALFPRIVRPEIPQPADAERP